jgi:hypothetical protein
VIARPYVRRQVRRLTVALIADGASFAAFALLVGFAGRHIERNVVIGAGYAFGGFAGVVALKLAVALAYEYRAARMPEREMARWWVGLFALVSSLALAGTMVGASLNLASLVDALR